MIFSALKHISTVTGILKGYDQLLNLVLDEVEEELIGVRILLVWMVNYSICPLFFFSRTRAS